MNFKHLLIALTVIALLGLSACGVDTDPYPNEEGVTVSLSEFEKIQNGMTLAEVEAIIGGSCTINSEVGEKGTALYTVSYGCNGKGDLGANALFMYQGGKLTVKSQAGLK